MLDVDLEFTALAIRAGLEEYGQYHETVESVDQARVEQLRQVAAIVAEVIGVEVGVAAVPTIDGMVRVCVIVARSSATESV